LHMGYTITVEHAPQGMNTGRRSMVASEL